MWSVSSSLLIDSTPGNNNYNVEQIEHAVHTVVQEEEAEKSVIIPAWREKLDRHAIRASSYEKLLDTRRGVTSCACGTRSLGI